jgi:hypothetical protein
MPTLYRTRDSTRADRIQHELEDMVIQHEVVIISSGDGLPDGAPVSAGDLPALHDDDAYYTEPDAIESHLATLRKLMGEWDKFGSDACHVGDDGYVCGPYGVHNDDGPGMTAP